MYGDQVRDVRGHGCGRAGGVAKDLIGALDLRVPVRGREFTERVVDEVDRCGRSATSP